MSWFNKSSEKNQSAQTKHCCIFDCLSADEAGRKLDFEMVEEYSVVDYTYTWDECTRRLVKCKNCGTLFLQMHFEFKAMGYDDDDRCYTYYYSVNSPDDALTHSKYNGIEIKDKHKGLFLKRIDGQWDWNK